MSIMVNTQFLFIFNFFSVIFNFKLRNFIYDRNCPKCYLKSAVGNSFRYNFNSYYGVKTQSPVTTTSAPTTAPVTTTRQSAPITSTSANPRQPICAVGDNTAYS
jgi:hypothetical protein